MSELLIGAGVSREKKMYLLEKEWTDLTTLDLKDADICHDLDVMPYPIEDGSFDEIHAYEVLEHCGTQGDVEFFFGQFNEFYRILKEKGVMYISVPNYNAIWAFGDPGHRRVLPHTVFSYLMRDWYDQVGKTSCSDYRPLINGYWQGLELKEDQDRIYLVLQRD